MPILTASTAPKKTYPLIDQNQVRRKAKALRAKLVCENKMTFLENYQDDRAMELVQQSFLHKHLDGFPHDNPLLIIAFNLQIVNLAVDYLCNTIESPLEAVFVASQIAEISNNLFIDPYDDKKLIKYLAASKEMGYFFTPPEIALLMAEKLLANTKESTVLDPAAGFGALLASTMYVASLQAVKLPSVTAIEIDSFTATNLEKLLNYAKDALNLDCRVHVLNVDAIEELSMSFNHNGSKRYDRIIMNPPYGRLKFLKSFLTNDETKVVTTRKSLAEQESTWQQKTEEIKSKIASIGQHLGLVKGLNEFSRVFTAIALEALSEKGRLSIISPSSWLGDKDSFEMRKMLIQNEWISEVILFREDSDLFLTVNQPTAVTVIERMKCNQLRLTSGSNRSIVQYDEIRKLEPNWLKIPRVSSELFEAYKTLNKHKKISEIAEIRNARGELDLSLHKHLISSKPTEMRLVRGDHIERYVTRPSEKSEKDGFVEKDSFVREFERLPKFQHTKLTRIAGRQCSYMDKPRRLSFSMVPPNVALGNSCNYLICSDKGGNGINEGMQWALLGCLNSIFVEWYFRIYNSNNHVANYEIDDFPVALEDPALVQMIVKSTKLLACTYKEDRGISTKPSAIENFHDAIVAVAYGLSPQMIEKIVSTIEPKRASGISNMAAQIYEGNIPDISNATNWFNHFESRLSDLDKEIIRHVPQGGNWMDIPESVPSQRLRQIREMTKQRGVVRTTYYGRLRPDQPSYTIATYFNRPGNGTNIHPWEDRTISLREAARLQSFPDYYIFLGSEGSIRKQIGNAVPPLLGYAVGKSLSRYKTNGTCVDAFAGAGGLSLGLELAGWQSICAFDNDKQAALTYCFNRPSTREITESRDKCLFLERDMYECEAQNEVILSIKKILGGRELNLLVGGPPCQGFSHAGFRRHDDRRNDLASIYLELAAELNPNTIILENVEGLLSFNKGKVVKDLLQTLRELGYKVAESPWLLCAEEYGVPQMRRRVMIVANKEDVIEPPIPMFQKCAGRREKFEQLQINPLPYPHTALDALHDLDALGKRTHSCKGSRSARNGYSHWLKDLLTIEELLSINDHNITN